jgi:hypothetical protein
MFITKAIFDQKNIFHPNRYLREKAGEPIPPHWEVSERRDGNKTDNSVALLPQYNIVGELLHTN